MTIHQVNQNRAGVKQQRTVSYRNRQVLPVTVLAVGAAMAAITVGAFVYGKHKLKQQQPKPANPAQARVIPAKFGIIAPRIDEPGLRAEEARENAALEKAWAKAEKSGSLPTPGP